MEVDWRDFSVHSRVAWSNGQDPSEAMEVSKVNLGCGVGRGHWETLSHLLAVSAAGPMGERAGRDTLSYLLAH